jgi:hypothetical protein
MRGIREIEEMKEEIKDFGEGYSVVETNDLSLIVLTHTYNPWIAYPKDNGKWIVFIIPELEDHSIVRIEELERVEYRMYVSGIYLRISKELFNNKDVKELINFIKTNTIIGELREIEEI